MKRTFIGINPDDPHPCRYGYLCAFVFANGGYYRFDFTRCGVRYRVSGWHGHGYLYNDQFGGVTARFYRRSGSLFTARRARGFSNMNWGPVWSLRVC